MAPLAVQAAGGVASFLSKYGKWLLLAALVVLLWQWISPFLRRIFGNVPDDAPYFVGGGDVLKGFYESRRNKADRLYKSLKKNSAWNDGRCEALKEAAGWNDNQLILIHNTFKNQHGVTLYDMIDDVVGDDCGVLDFGYYDVTLKNRLSDLGVV